MTTASMPGTMTGEPQGRREMAFALGIILILCFLFLPIPPLLIDLGLAFSIALSVLILMVALWIEKPLEFSAFPTVLLSLRCCVWRSTSRRPGSSWRTAAKASRPRAM